MGQQIELRKPHACGGHRWSITRGGADIGLECDTCRRRIMLPRDEFNRRLRRIVSAVPGEDDRLGPETPGGVS